MRMRFSSEKLVLFAYFSGIILMGSAVLALPGVWQGPGPLSYVDALFTATSAVCVTGLITVDTALYSRFGKAVIATLIQLGGLGIIAFATIYVTLPRKRISLVNRRIIKEYYIDEVEYNPKVIVIHILLTTLGLELAGAILLYLRFRELPDAAFVAGFHAVSAFCNAGFSTFSNSLENYVGDPLVNATVMFLVISGGLGFIVWRDLAKFVQGKKRRLSTQTKIVLGVSAVLVALGALVFYWLEARHAMRGLKPAERVLAALFQAVTPRTAGFDTISPARLSDGSVLLTMLLMFIGASPGSTGGGVKTTTFFVVLLAAMRGLDEKSRLTIGRRSVFAKTVLKAYGVVGKGLVLIVVAASALLVLEHRALSAGEMSLVELLFETISAFGTVGLSLGVTSRLAVASKLVLVATMFAGRVGLFAMTLPSGSRDLERYVDLPSTDMMIG